MSTKAKTWIITISLLLCIFLSFAFPKAKHEGTGFIREIEIPSMVSKWVGKDVSDQLGIDYEDSVFNFISDALAYQYVNDKGEELLFIILDAGNFHHPNVCFTYAGYEIRELDDTQFQLSDRSLLTHSLFTQKRNESYLTFYWITIDKNIAHQWIEQKIKQLYFSLFNKKRVGLMIRIDIPTTDDDIDTSKDIANKFINDLYTALSPAHSDYIFGEQ